MLSYQPDHVFFALRQTLFLFIHVRRAVVVVAVVAVAVVDRRLLWHTVAVIVDTVTIVAHWHQSVRVSFAGRRRLAILGSVSAGHFRVSVSLHVDAVNVGLTRRGYGRTRTAWHYKRRENKTSRSAADRPTDPDAAPNCPVAPGAESPSFVSRRRKPGLGA